MNQEKLTDRSQGFIQAAQTLAVRHSNQFLTPEHLLKVLLDDKDGMAASLLAQSGADVAHKILQNCLRFKGAALMFQLLNRF